MPDDGVSDFCVLAGLQPELVDDPLHPLVDELLRGPLGREADACRPVEELPGFPRVTQ